MNLHELKKWVQFSQFNVTVAPCAYTDIEQQRARYAHAMDQFEQVYDVNQDDQLAVFSTSGRTEIGGNHTDHQLGCVLAAAIDKDMIAIARRNDTKTVNCFSIGFDRIQVSLDSLNVVESEYYTSISLIRGIAHKMNAQAQSLGGFDVVISSTVPLGSGMSSSAAFEVLIATIFNHFYANQSFSDVEIAQIGQFAENVYFNKPCGLMDQMAASVGGFVFIDFFDHQNPKVEKIDVSFEQTKTAFLLVDTKGSHAGLSDEYGFMPQEMKQVASILDTTVLSRVSLATWQQSIVKLREEVSDRAILRSYHFLHETVRAQEQAEALKLNDYPRFFQLVNESGQSSFMYLQNVIKSGEIADQSLALALALVDSIIGVSGAKRVHGGGLAGSIIAFVPLDKVSELTLLLESVFGHDSVVPLNLRRIGSTRLI